MNIVTLKTFLAVVELKNLNKAAERLNVTQSTVSARLDALEESLGQRLLVRARSGAQMTKAGFALQRHAENTVQAWELGRRAIELPEGYQATVSISCEHDLWEGNVELWLDRVTSRNPSLAVEVWPGARIEINTWLGSGLIDAAITREPVSGEGIATRLFDQDELVHVRAADSDEGVPFVMVDHGPEFRRNFARDAKLARITYGTGGSRWALDQILSGNCSGYLPARMIGLHLASGRLQPIGGASTYRISSHLSWRQSSSEEHPWLLEQLRPGEPV